MQRSLEIAMTPEQIGHVKATFRRARRAGAPVSQRFCALLFERAPALRRLFAADMAERHGQVSDMLAYLVFALEDQQALQATLGRIAVRHLGCRARPVDFVDVGLALKQALREVTPGGLDPAENAAWDMAIFAVAGIMIATMEDAAV
jgi:hemoglobin-like flavoprotein